ncbi:transposase [Salmonella enterica subsp. enterica]|nr:transposase [Salmonella enterica subsp. enterica]
MDGLTGFPEAINNIYPRTKVRCVSIHQIRNSLNMSRPKHHKAFMADLKRCIVRCPKTRAETALDELEEKPGSAVSVVPVVATQMGESVGNRYPANIRKVIYARMQSNRCGVSSGS